MNKIIMPSGGQTTDESEIVKWHKKVGDPVKRGDVLFEIETDKATLEVESYCEGYLRAAYYQEGDKVAAGEIVAYVGGEQEALPQEEGAKAEQPQETAPQAVEEEEEEYQPIMGKRPQAAASASSQQKTAPEPAQAQGKPLASPRAKQAARERGVDLQKVVPGPLGVIKYQNVLDYLEQKSADESDYEDVPLSSMRRTIARRMRESMDLAPHYTVSMDVDMGACIALRKKINDYLGGEVKVSFNDLLAKCVAKAVEAYPLINSSYLDDCIRMHRHVHVGLAVGVENGLLVPVVRSVDQLSLAQIARQNTENIQKAKAGKLAPSDMSGGTITISNLGMFDVDHFTAVINQPESCILAVGRIAERAVSVNHTIVSREMMNITASFDHRGIDGAVGAQFLRQVKRLLEQPELLLV